MNSRPPPVRHPASPQLGHNVIAIASGVDVYHPGLGYLDGFAGGMIMWVVLRFRGVVPEGLENVFTLSLVLASCQRDATPYLRPAVRFVERIDPELSIGELPMDDRVVLYLRYFLDLPEREIATAIGKRPGTVKSRLHRASARLRVVIQQDYPTLAPAPVVGEESSG